MSSSLVTYPLILEYDQIFQGIYFWYSFHLNYFLQFL